MKCATLSKSIIGLLFYKLCSGEHYALKYLDMRNYLGINAKSWGCGNILAYLSFGGVTVHGLHATNNDMWLHLAHQLTAGWSYKPHPLTP